MPPSHATSSWHIRQNRAADAANAFDPHCSRTTPPTSVTIYQNIVSNEPITSAVTRYFIPLDSRLQPLPIKMLLFTTASTLAHFHSTLLQPRRDISGPLAQSVVDPKLDLMLASPEENRRVVSGSSAEFKIKKITVLVRSIITQCETSTRYTEQLRGTTPLTINTPVPDSSCLATNMRAHCCRVATLGRARHDGQPNIRLKSRSRRRVGAVPTMPLNTTPHNRRLPYHC